MRLKFEKDMRSPLNTLIIQIMFTYEIRSGVDLVPGKLCQAQLLEVDVHEGCILSSFIFYPLQVVERDSLEGQS